MRFNIEFERKGLLGRGSNSSVWLATNRLDRKDYAVKMAYYDGEIDPKVLREIIISSELNHVNIVRYFSSWTEIHPPEYASYIFTLFFNLKLYYFS
jgi:serine/threonine protein kinase